MVFLVPIFCFGEDTKTDKIGLFISQVGSFVDHHPGWTDFKENSPGRKELMSILNSVNETESLEALNLLTDKDDIQEFNYTIQAGTASKEDLKKLLVYTYIYSGLYEKWKNETKDLKEILMKKVMPVIINKKYNPNLKRSFTVNINYYLNGMHISDEDRNFIMNELSNIFSDNKNPLSLKCEAARTWGGHEKREKTFLEKFKYLKNNPEILKGSVYYLSHNRHVNQDLLAGKILGLLDEVKEETAVNNILMGLSSLNYNNPGRKAMVKNKLDSLSKQEKNGKLKNLYNSYKK